MNVAIGLVCLFIVLALLEFFVPLRNQKRLRWHRWLINILMGGALYGAAALSIEPTIRNIMTFTTQSHFGLMHVLQLPLWLEVTIGVMLLDLTFYYWHRLNHEVSLLWRFHNVHHTDPDMDVSTALRFHFVEIIYSSVFRLLQLGMLGVSPLTLIIFQALFQGNTFIHHSNIRFPINLERLLNKLIVTPRMHGIHHSQVRTETNANYSSIFSLWDRLHKTLIINVPQKNVSIGVAGYSQPKDNYLWNLIRMPFVKQHDYARDSEGHEVVRHENELIPQPQTLAD